MYYVGTYHDGTIYRVRDPNRALARLGNPVQPWPKQRGRHWVVPDRRLLVGKTDDGTIYRIDLDPRAARGRTISPIAGATVLEGCGVLLDGHRLVVADSKACRSSSSARTPPADPSPSSPQTLVPRDGPTRETVTSS